MSQINFIYDPEQDAGYGRAADGRIFVVSRAAIEQAVESLGRQHSANEEALIFSAAYWQHLLGAADATSGCTYLPKQQTQTTWRRLLKQQADRQNDSFSIVSN